MSEGELKKRISKWAEYLTDEVDLNYKWHDGKEWRTDSKDLNIILHEARKDFPKLRSDYDGDFDVDTNPNSEDYLPLLIEYWFKKWFGDT